MKVEWTDYMKYRATLHGFDLARVEEIVKHSVERYFDTETGCRVVIGHHDGILVIVPYEANQDLITPITIHTTTRQQIRFRIQTGRYALESDKDGIF